MALTSKVALLALYTAVLVGALEWAVAVPAGIDPRHRLEALVPGGVTTLTVAWAVASLWLVTNWLHGPSAPVPGLAVLGLYLLLVLYLDQWVRRVALPTQGGISPSEVRLYIDRERETGQPRAVSTQSGLRSRDGGLDLKRRAA